MTQLKRRLNLTLVTLYGVGTILGAGIYVLTGVVAERAGLLTPLCFLLAGVVAAFTAFSYAELSARYPKSAGEVNYVQEAMQLQWLSRIVGFAVILVGSTSAATISRGFVGYLDIFIQLPHTPVIIGLVLLLGTIAFYGVLESVSMAATITIIEIIGLLMVVGASLANAGNWPMTGGELFTQLPMGNYTGLFAGAFIAFFAFIGFEDIVNVAEEVENPHKNMPRAILLSMVVSSALYFGVAFIAVLAVPMTELAGNEAPMALIIEKSGMLSPQVISFISMLAVVNGALVQIIMGSRVVYGMSMTNVLPKFFGHVHEKTRTPSRATFAVTTFVLTLALAFPLESLAELTSLVTLTVFALVNISLIIVKKRIGPDSNAPNYPMAIPIIGLVLCLLMIVI